MFNRIAISGAIYLTEPYEDEKETITIYVPDELQNRFFSDINNEKPVAISLIGDHENRALKASVSYANEYGDHVVIDRRLKAEIKIGK